MDILRVVGWEEVKMYNELVKFWGEVLRPMNPPDWKLPNHVSFENDSLYLRCFVEKPDTARVPILILSPNAGHHLNICEPLIQRCLKVDATRGVYVIHWKEPASDSRIKNDSISDMIRNVSACVDAIGGKVHLFGLCQGAWASAIYTALNPDNVLSYTNAAGPIDFCAGEGKIQTICQSLPLSFYSDMVDNGGGVQKGEMQLFGFRAMNPYDRYIADYLDLWYAVCEGSNKDIEKWRRFKEWYDQPLDLAGAWYVEAVDKLFKKNMLVKGELVIDGRKVDLANIKCPIFLIGGENDDITPPCQVFNLEKYVHVPVTAKIIAGAGHIGVFVKASSLDYWENTIIRRLDQIAAGVVTQPEA